MAITTLFERRVTAASEADAITIATLGYYLAGGAALPGAVSYNVVDEGAGRWAVSCYVESVSPSYGSGVVVPSGLVSVPATGGKKVTNIFVNSTGKLEVQYET